MRKGLAVAVLALPLIAADCGGDLVRSPTGCTLRVRGAVTEDLVCQASMVDYSALEPTTTEWAFQIVGARLDGRSQVDVSFFLPARPTVGQPYGWTATTSSVESGDAARVVADLVLDPAATTTAAPTMTHESKPPFLAPDDGVGAITVAFTGFSPPSVPTAPGAVGAHGTLDGTLVATDGSGATISIHAEF